MKLVDQSYVESHTEEILEAIRNGSIFIYPTDTVYGLGANALADSSVEKVRMIKHRDTKPFSVIAPSGDWIEKNCVISRAEINKYLPGPVTLILKSLKGAVSQYVNPQGDTLGVRIPDHWFSRIVAQAGVPFVTTSVNISGEKHMESIEEVPQEILGQVDYVVYEGEKRGTPSRKIFLV